MGDVAKIEVVTQGGAHKSLAASRTFIRAAIVSWPASLIVFRNLPHFKKPAAKFFESAGRSKLKSSSSTKTNSQKNP
jgi:hypothetical protein